MGKITAYDKADNPLHWKTPADDAAKAALSVLHEQFSKQIESLYMDQDAIRKLREQAELMLGDATVQDNARLRGENARLSQELIQLRGEKNADARKMRHLETVVERQQRQLQGAPPRFLDKGDPYLAQPIPTDERDWTGDAIWSEVGQGMPSVQLRSHEALQDLQKNWDNWDPDQEGWFTRFCDHPITRLGTFLAIGAYTI